MTRGDLFQRRQRLHHHGIGLEQADGEAALAAQCRRRREQHLLHVLIGDRLADLLGPHHLDPVHHLARKRGVRIDEGDGLISSCLVQRTQQLDADRAGAVDDDALPLIEAHAFMFGREPEQGGAGPLSAETNEPGGDQAIDHDHRPRMHLDAAHQHDERPQHRGDDYRDIDAGGALWPDEASDELVEPAHIEDDHADHGRGRHQEHLGKGVGHVELA